MLLYELTDAFQKAKLKYAIVGGYALALHGIVRATMDVDFVLQLKKTDFELAERVLGELGLTSRLPVSAKEVILMREEYIRNRNLIAWSFIDYKNPTRQVDILITFDLKDLDTQEMKLNGKKLTVVTLRQLLKMKTQSARPQDLVDIKSIQEKLDEKNEA